MQKLVLLLLFAAILANSSCKKESGESDESGGSTLKVNVHLWSAFDNDQVAVLIDGEQIFNDKITTNYILGLAEQTSALRGFGSHTIEIKVNDQSAGKKTIFLTRETWIGVGYDEDKFNFTVAYKPWYYN